jgi:trimeric autotransporter adhesin
MPMKKVFFCFLLLLPVVSQAQYITTFAGDGTSGYEGDGGQSTSAKISYPRGVAVDNSGNVYIACWDNHVRKINASGIISTFAGNGVSGNGGDGGPATAAQLNSPTTIAFDGAGNVYIADGANNKIRKVNTSGIISTFAGTGTIGSAGDGGPATSAQINYTAGITFDGSGNAYIADYWNCKIRKITPAGIISTFAGTGSAGYSGDGGAATAAKLYYPARVAVDGVGNVYIADYGNNRIRRVNSSGVISLVAGSGSAGFSGDGGPASAAKLSGPVGINVDGSGNLYIADWGNSCIRKVNSTGVITTIAGTGVAGFNGDCIPANSAELNQSIGIALDESGHIYISNYGDHRVRVISTTCNLAINNIINNDELVNIYPNPTTTSITISAPTKITQLTIANLLGQTVYTHAYNTEKVEVNVSSLPAGLYFIKINNTEVRKFVKQ